MRVHFDQGTPVPLRRALVGHTVATAFEMGWSEMGNGDLLRAAEASFDALITTDQNLQHQQSLGGLELRILILPTTSSMPRRRGRARVGRESMSRSGAAGDVDPRQAAEQRCQGDETAG